MFNNHVELGFGQINRLETWELGDTHALSQYFANTQLIRPVLQVEVRLSAGPLETYDEPSAEF
jgi:hypothetical protein